MERQQGLCKHSVMILGATSKGSEGKKDIHIFKTLPHVAWFLENNIWYACFFSSFFADIHTVN